jgi:hypothetical protein
MPKGLIERINKTLVTIKVAHEWDYDHDYGEWHPRRYPITVTLHMEPALIDKAIALHNNLLEFQVKGGKVTYIKKIKPPPSPPPSKLDLLLTGYKPKSLRDKLQVLLETLKELGGEREKVSKTILIEKLEKAGITKEETEKLIRHLELEGTIYEPEDGFLKKT